MYCMKVYEHINQFAEFLIKHFLAYIEAKLFKHRTIIVYEREGSLTEFSNK